MRTILQGEIWYSDLDPVKGSEQSGLRPVLIVSGNLANAYLKTVICCPLTSKIKYFKGNVVLSPSWENGLNEQSEILTFHIRSITKERLINRIGFIEKDQLQKVKEGLDEIWKY